MNLNSAKTPVAVPPMKGSFPLDKQGKCKNQFKSYMECLKTNEHSNGVCRPVARDYLQCRMDHGLMTKEDMEKIGYKDISKSNQ